MNTCRFPENSPKWAYRKGCRCDGCRAVKSESSQGRDKRTRPCPGCGDLTFPHPGMCRACSTRSPIDRVMDRVSIDSCGCWIYGGTKTLVSHGYGQITVPTGTRKARQRVAHHVTYEHYHGPIPAGLEIDHLCNRPECVNPDHLEAVTHAENMARARQRRREAAA